MISFLSVRKKEETTLLKTLEKGMGSKEKKIVNPMSAGKRGRQECSWRRGKGHR